MLDGDYLEDLARRGERLEVELNEWLADCDRAKLGLPNLLWYARAAMVGIPDLIRAKARQGPAGVERWPDVRDDGG